MRRRTMQPLPDDGLVPIPTKHGPVLVTPEQAHARAQHIMADFDELPPAERHYLNYTNRIFGSYSPALSVSYYKILRTAHARRGIKTEAKAIKQLDVALF